MHPGGQGDAAAPWRDAKLEIFKRGTVKGMERKRSRFLTITRIKLKYISH